MPGGSLIWVLVTRVLGHADMHKHAASCLMGSHDAAHRGDTSFHACNVTTGLTLRSDFPLLRVLVAFACL